jgi:hypothetical protein
MDFELFIFCITVAASLLLGGFGIIAVGAFLSKREQVKLAG